MSSVISTSLSQLSVENLEYRAQGALLQRSFQQFPSQKTTNSILVRKFLEEQTESTWNAMATGVITFLSSVSQEVFPGARILICLPDGKVAYDSGRNNNSYENFEKGLINENHNTRVSIMVAILSESGIGFEIKPSSSVGTLQTYNAHRTGPTTSEPQGTVRVSYDILK